MSVESLSKARRERATSNADLTPSDALHLALDDLEGGEYAATSLMVLSINRDDEDFSTNWWASNLSASEMISLMEIVKAQLLRDMGLT